MNQITEILQKVERDYNVQILYACETGSRGWGFPSPDSDYDIRFIYMNEPNWYLSLSEKKDTIEFMDGDWDLSGWDVRKALRLLSKSNAPMIEKLNSPIVYLEKEGFRKQTLEITKEVYNPIAVFHHYFSLVNNFWDSLKYEREQKLKSLLYVSRSLLSSIWVLKDEGIVPMQLKELMVNAPAEIREKLKGLVEFKLEKSEKYLHSFDEELNGWINETICFLDKEKNNIRVQQVDYEILNDYFKKLWHEANNHRNG